MQENLYLEDASFILSDFDIQKFEEGSSRHLTTTTLSYRNRELYQTTQREVENYVRMLDFMEGLITSGLLVVNHPNPL